MSDGCERPARLLAGRAQDDEQGAPIASRRSSSGRLDDLGFPPETRSLAWRAFWTPLRDSVPGRRRPPLRSEIRTRAGAALPRALRCPRRGLTPRPPATDVEPLCRHFSASSRLFTGQCQWRLEPPPRSSENLAAAGLTPARLGALRAPRARLAGSRVGRTAARAPSCPFPNRSAALRIDEVGRDGRDHALGHVAVSPGSRDGVVKTRGCAWPRADPSRSPGRARAGPVRSRSARPRIRACVAEPPRGSA